MNGESIENFVKLDLESIEISKQFFVNQINNFRDKLIYCCKKNNIESVNLLDTGFPTYIFTLIQIFIKPEKFEEFIDMLVYMHDYPFPCDLGRNRNNNN